MYLSMINCNLCLIYRRSSTKNYNFKKNLLSLFCSTASSSKRTSSEFPPVYDPKIVEKDRYDWWEKNGCFKSQNPQSSTFSMILPPPNITGTLHLGHTLVKKMQGVPVSWIPGIDHAGIATQVVVERKLWKEKMCTRHDIGRENFIKLISNWKSEKEKIICDQLRKLGASVNWEEIFFTLDPERTISVVEAFIKLYESGLIYRTNSIINWSTSIKSAISDIEIDLKEVNAPTLLDVPGYDNPVEFGIMTEIACKLYGSDEEISIATTRVETMPGDVAIAVNPNDGRYVHLHGKMVFHPIRNTHIPIICDEFVDPEFGTGAVKITPAHNKNDFLVGEKHNLQIIHAIDEDGKITSCCPQFAGLKRFEARRKILEKLESQGLVRSKKPHSMQIPFCSRSGDVLEFLIKPQW
ncbi:hypothetical protein J437_LFUL007665 [Ladona fulva]|uniref:valine--tRNA ligase n=1 Tax=Ladona fulva TaxID=123851 RepID=A0A8K0P0S8_LADFU|nr:hypothetical protein J437_LFUL007665 [Ladona fulva]